MNFIDKIFNNLYKTGVVFGGVCLTGIMLLIVAGVVTRLFGFVILGVYELTELIAIMVGGFALAYTTFEQGHTVVGLLTERLPVRLQSALKIFTHAIGAVLWGAIAWVGLNVLLTRWTGEHSELLKVPFLPFRFIWVITLILITLAFIISSIKAFSAWKGGGE